MQPLWKIVQLAKHFLARRGFLNPVLIIEDTKERVGRPYPDASEGEKLLLLDALGYTLAVKDQAGELQQVFMICEAYAYRTLEDRAAGTNQMEVVLVGQHDVGGASSLAMY